MRKIIFHPFMFLAVSFSSPSFAVDWMQLVNVITQVYGVNLDMKNLDMDSLDQLKNMNDSLTGMHNYGGRFSDDRLYDWSAGNWQDLLSLARGGGSGEMADAISRLARDFPIEEFQSPNTTETEYYRLQAQTALASRAASEVAFQQAVREEKNMQRLQGEIDRTRDVKSSADLNNRLVAESAINNVQQTKLLAVIAQQQALDAQEKVNRAREDREFFSIR